MHGYADQQLRDEIAGVPGGPGEIALIMGGLNFMPPSEYETHGNGARRQNHAMMGGAPQENADRGANYMTSLM